MIGPFKAEFGWLSNFWPCRLKYEGKEYRTVEHAYQAAKTTDKYDRERIRQASSPAKAKRYGRKVKLRKDWEEVKVGIMLDLLRIKFDNFALRRRLFDTRGQKLVEVNDWHDTFWGVCNDVGGNMLGTLLMVVRQEIIKERRLVRSRSLTAASLMAIFARF